MKLEVENLPTIEAANEDEVRHAIKVLRSYGPSSFASLTDEKGNYLQVAGGGVTCMLERRDAEKQRHFRAYHDGRSKVFPDGTFLAFGGGKIKMAADEWFTADVVTDAFSSFLCGRDFPSSIKWREMTQMFSDA